MESRAWCRSDCTRTPWSRSVNAPPNPEDTAPAERQGFWKRFSKTLEAGRQSYVADIKEVFGRPALDAAFWDDLETTLIAADAGVPTTERVVQDLRRQAAGAHLRSPADALAYLRADLVGELEGRPRALNLDGAPAVVLVVGVNGSGKTTTIGKLAYLLRREGSRPLLAAGDTFRAAAIDQLRLWGERAGVEVVAHQSGSDPGAVAFDAVQAARARGASPVIIDTAGRLHTRSDLMEELRKVRRVLERLDPKSPQEVLAVLDAHVGQNSAQQVKVFQEAIGLTGLALTKMDGSARSEEHTSELQSQFHLVCRLLLEKKKKRYQQSHTSQV